MDQVQILRYPGFTIMVPSTWVSGRDRNDPETILVTMDETDQFRINIGIKSENMTRFQHILVEDVTIEEVVDKEKRGRILEEKRIIKRTDLHSDIHLELISNREVQSLVPKKSGHGATGVFFETVDSLKGRTFPVSFLAFNLKAENEKRFFTAVQTLMFDP